MSEENLAHSNQPTDLIVGSVSMPEVIAHTEIGELGKLLTDNESTLGPSEIMAVGEAGFLVRLGNRPLVEGNDWVLYDLDDTLIAYSQAKGIRLKSYQQYLKETGLSLEADDCASLLDLTDGFSRWEQEGVEMYHIDAHKMALDWATQVVRSAPEGAKHETVLQLQTQFERIKADGLAESDPFTFQGDQLTLKEGSARAENLEGVFRSMIEPETYGDALESLVEVGTNNTDEPQINTGIFTYGEPVFQLQKIVELIKTRTARGESTPVSHIWLTKVPKGTFLKQLAEDNVSEVFGPEPHVLLLVDDNPKELDNFFEAGSPKATIESTRLGVIRSVREGTKAEGNQWGRLGHIASGSLARGLFEVNDPQDNNLTEDIYTYLLNNLSRAVYNHSESSSPLPELANKLNARVHYYADKAKNSSKPRYIVTINDTQRVG